jgi:hypothetical protein
MDRFTRDSCYTEFMALKNVTITLDEDVARWARIWAARQETSVSRLLGGLLREKMLQEEGYEAAMQQYLAVHPRELKTTGRYPPRTDIHQRPDR